MGAWLKSGTHVDLVGGFTPKMREADDAVAVEGRFTGTHTGPLATDDGDVEPTGATVDLRFADVSRVRDGKIVAYHTYDDQLGLLTQLGLMGDPG